MCNTDTFMLGNFGYKAVEKNLKANTAGVGTLLLAPVTVWLPSLMDPASFRRILILLLGNHSVIKQ